MTLDQRIEALTQSLELMAHMQRDAETKHDKITAETDVRLHNITRVLDELTSMMRELISLAGNHENRLKRLES